VQPLASCGQKFFDGLAREYRQTLFDGLARKIPATATAAMQSWEGPTKTAHRPRVVQSNGIDERGVASLAVVSRE
jgi:hypothetical protein